MDNFDKIIKQKVEEFEVPYNEAHWAEMDGRLNSIRAAKIKNTIFGSVATIAVIALSTYLIFSYNNNVAVEDNDYITENKTSEGSISHHIENNNNETVIGTNDMVENNTIVVEEENTHNLKEESSIETIEDFEKEKIETNSSPVQEDKKISNEIEVEGDVVNTGFIVYNNRVCLGEEVSFEALETNQPVAYTWNFGDGTISHKANPTHVYKSSGDYTVTLSLLNRQKGVEYPSSIEENAVIILDLPDAEFTYSEVSLKYDDNTLKYPYTEFSIKGKDKENTYNWIFGNGMKSTSINAKTIYKKAGSYDVTLVATNSNGCINKKTTNIVVKNSAKVFAENAFTPNGDGTNDYFLPKAIQDWDVKFKMTILNKSGKIVYETSDKNSPWNGKLNNTGQLMPYGYYLWELITYDADGIPQRHKGQIQMLEK